MSEQLRGTGDKKHDTLYNIVKLKINTDKYGYIQINSNMFPTITYYVLLTSEYSVGLSQDRDLTISVSSTITPPSFYMVYFSALFYKT